MLGDGLGHGLRSRCAVELLARRIEVEPDGPLADAEDDARLPRGFPRRGPFQAVELPRRDENLSVGVMAVDAQHMTVQKVAEDGSSIEPLSSLTKAQALQLRADVSYSVLAPFGRSDSIPKERKPVPDERYRNRDVIKDVESGNWLDGDCNYPRRQCRTDPVAQGGEYALQRVVIGQHRDHHDQHDA